MSDFMRGISTISVLNETATVPDSRMEIIDEVMNCGGDSAFDASFFEKLSIERLDSIEISGIVDPNEIRPQCDLKLSLSAKSIENQGNESVELATDTEDTLSSNGTDDEPHKLTQDEVLKIIKQISNNYKKPSSSSAASSSSSSSQSPRSPRSPRSPQSARTSFTATSTNSDMYSDDSNDSDVQIDEDNDDDDFDYNNDENDEDYEDKKPIKMKLRNKKPKSNIIKKTPFKRQTTRSSRKQSTAIDKKMKNCKHVWQFLRDQLREDSKHVEWVNKDQGIFKIKNQTKIAELWGDYKERKSGKVMDYEKMSRGIRHSRKDGFFKFIDKDQPYGVKLIYQFGDKAIMNCNWLKGFIKS